MALCLLVVCVGVSAFVAIFALLAGDDGVSFGYPVATVAILSFIAAFAALLVWARNADAPQDTPPTRLVLRSPKLGVGSIALVAFLVLNGWRMYGIWQDSSMGSAWTIPTYTNLLHVDGTLTEFDDFHGRTGYRDYAIVRTASGQNLVLNCTPGTEQGGCFDNVRIGNWIYQGTGKLSVPVTVLYFQAHTNRGDAQNVLVELRTANAVPIPYQGRIRDLEQEQARYQNRMRRPNLFHLLMLGLLGLVLYSLLFKRVPIEPASSDGIPTAPLGGRDLRSFFEPEHSDNPSVDQDAVASSR